MIFGIIAISALHRGGISFQTHLLWAVSLLPILTTLYLQKNRHQRHVPTPLLAIIMIFTLSIMFGWLTSTMKDFGFVSVTSLLCGVATLLITLQLDVSEELIHKLFASLCVFTASLCIFGLALYISTPTDRLASSFAHLPYLISSYPNGFALFLIGLLPYALYRFGRAYQFQHHSPEKATWFTITALMLIALLLTFSRGGLIVSILIMAFFILRKKLPLNKALAGLFIIVIVGTGITQAIRTTQFETNNFTKKITLQSDEKSSSVNERIDFWKGSLQLIKSRPLTGYGPDTFAFTYPYYQTHPLATSGHPHNMLLKQAVEFGIPSGLLYLALIIWILILGYRCEEKKELMAILILSVLGIVAHNMIDYNLNFTSNAMLLWALLGLILNIALAHTKAHPTLITPRRILYSISMLAALALFVSGGYEIYQREKIVHARTLTANQQYIEAENIFATIHPLFFEDAVLLRAHNALEMNNFTLANQLFNTITQRNRLYAEAYNLWAEMFMKQKEYTKADILNTRALQLDRFNRLRYHLNHIMINQKLRGALPDNVQKGYETMMQSYLILLQNNSHNTIITDDPTSALKIVDLLQTTTTNQLHIIKLKSLATKLLTSAQEEEKKFFDKFYIPVPPL